MILAAERPNACERWSSGLVSLSLVVDAFSLVDKIVLDKSLARMFQFSSTCSEWQGGISGGI